ncbi:MAG TPA: glutaminyl-peptide cyclotransferase, partial [Pyrinomonadaceae bacterium]
MRIVFSPRVAQNARMLRMFKTRLLLTVALSIASLQCNGAGSPSSTNKAAEGANKTAETPAAPVNYGYQIVNIYPHDSAAFTQGLVFIDGKLYEGTGQEGHSSLREVELQSGHVLRKVDVPEPYFGEGIALLNGKIYQLTWQHQVGFIYDAKSFEQVGKFNYSGEGWGLTTDGHSLILSDGSNRIRFLDPDSFKVTKTIAVLDGQIPVNELNELEYVNGEIYANIWHDEHIVTIDPQTGRVTGRIDLTGLLPPGDVQDEEAVLNGIAYDEPGKRLFVTGKLWPRLFEIKLKR